MRSLLLVTALAACSKGEAGGGPPPRDAPPSDAPLSHSDAAGPPAVWKIAGGFSTPESVLWDEVADVYLVSNINGGGHDKDDNGFISRVSPPPDAKVIEVAWIDGAEPGVRLDGPKGMALLGDTLYVADIDTVRRFDRVTGAPKGEVPVPGGMFVNDLVAGDGVVYASDTGVDGHLEPTGNQALWEIRGDRAVPLLAGDDLGGPNGLAIVDGELWIVGFVDGSLYRRSGGPRERLPLGTLDGIVVLPDGTFAISSWDAAGVFVGRPGAWTLGPRHIPGPADLGLDARRGLLLIPSFPENRIELHRR